MLTSIHLIYLRIVTGLVDVCLGLAKFRLLACMHTRYSAYRLHLILPLPMVIPALRN